MPRSLSERTIATVKATAPALALHGLAVTREMYANMFRNPAIRDLFNQSHHGDNGSQPQALAGAILAYAQNIDNLEALTGAVERIAQKHVGLQILPEHYPYVADALLAAIRTVLGDAATDEIMDAWGEAYWFLADVLIEREQTIYKEIAGATGGWNGWRDFVVADIIRESNIINSFVLRPADGGPVVRQKPGQYLTLWLSIPGQPPLKRNYTVSAASDGASYRITVKREPRGLASRWLHDRVKVGDSLKVGAPAGDFYLQPGDSPVVLLSGGVGLTPMVAMLESLAAEGARRQVLFAHGAFDSSAQAMAAHVRELAARLPDGKAVFFHEAPSPASTPGGDFDEEGVISGDWLKRQTPVAEADYYICGPRPMLRDIIAALVAAGVPAGRIHYEFFGPADEALAA
ncbi:flavohemoprotein [Camelimonas fluminis]|uniref:nitric oxide dioxygenase n=1 Tax=Camelimonas fluminis TaxID=1576911 RepID=A0ABV7UJ42_9HYPH|nr:NO-inducible flavohemoprotein [Camelimonas fluminis]GHE63243.1 flavohemoprotein [Camelimonas fluminis]